MLCDSIEGILALLYNYRLTGLDCTVAVTVANDLCAAAFNKLGEVGVIVLASREHYLAAERPLCVGLTGLHFLRCLAQVGKDEILRAYQRYELDDMELIAGDGRIIKLAVIAYLVYELADLIVLLDGFLERLIGNIDSEIVMQCGQNMSPELIAEVFIVVLGVFKGNVGELAEELVVLDDVHVLDGVKMLGLNVLLEAAGDGAGLGRHLCVEEIEAAFECALEKAAAIVTYAGGHVVSRDVG